MQYPVLLIGKGACRFQIECFSFAGESMSLQEGPGERLSPASCIYKAFGSWLNSNNKPAFSIRVSRFAHIMHTNYTTRVRSGRRKHGCESLGFVSALKRSTLQQIVFNERHDMKAVNDIKRTLRVSNCQDVSQERENVEEGPTHKARLITYSHARSAFLAFWL